MKPTYLYVKRHTITGKCYFGKTTSSDPIKYKGSGKHWNLHIKKHGCEYVETLWYKLFTNRDECVKEALKFSKENNIVDSELWLNLIPENGLDGPGRVKGYKMSQESRDKLSKSRIGIKMSEEQKAKVSAQWKGRIITTKHREAISSAHTGKLVSTETCTKLSIAAKNRSQEWREKQKFAQSKRLTCPHCSKDGGFSAMKRWHFDNCPTIGEP
jgi:hypothetical protein